MDALAEILRVIKLDSAIYLNGEFSEPWCITSPESSALAPLFVRAGAHVIIYHLLCEGRAYFEIEDGERIELSAGDLVALPHGHGHRMGSGRRVTAVDVRSTLPGVLARGLELLQCRRRRRALPFHLRLPGLRSPSEPGLSWRPAVRYSPQYPR